MIMKFTTAHSVPRRMTHNPAALPPRTPTAEQMAAGRELLTELEAEAGRPVTQAEIDEIHRQWDEA